MGHCQDKTLPLATRAVAHRRMVRSVCVTVPCVASAVASAIATPTASTTLRVMPGCETERREAARGCPRSPHRSMPLLQGVLAGAAAAARSARRGDWLSSGAGQPGGVGQRGLANADNKPSKGL